MKTLAILLLSFFSVAAYAGMQTTTTNPCYNTLGYKLVRGTTWDVPDDGLLLPKDVVKTEVAAAMQKWEDAANYNIYGDYASGGVGQIRFASLDPGVVSYTFLVTSTKGKKISIVGFNTVLNSYYTWGTDGDPSKMDLPSVLLHEMGHIAGMGEEYSCDQDAMFIYIVPGEVKRSLGPDDIIGINTLY